MAGILEHEEYIGNTINCRTYTPSFKSKKSRLNTPDKILRFEGTHEPLIDPVSYTHLTLPTTERV